MTDLAEMLLQLGPMLFLAAGVAVAVAIAVGKLGE